MSLPVEEIENLLSEIERADPYESAAIASSTTAQNCSLDPMTKLNSGKNCEWSDKTEM